MFIVRNGAPLLIAISSHTLLSRLLPRLFCV